MSIDRVRIAIHAVAITLLLGGCQEQGVDRPAQLEKLILDSGKNVRLNDLRAVFVLTEDGCLPCSKAFSGILEEHLDDTTCLFWVSALGTGLDITPYRSTGERVIWDYDDRLRASGILLGSGAILLKSGQIDTIIPIGNARTVAASLNYLSDRLQLERSDSLGGDLTR